MNIHSLFILKTTGNCLYSRNFLNLDKSFDIIIIGFEKIDLDLYNKLNRLFQYLILNNEIIGAAVLLTSGQVIYSSLSKKLLLGVLRN
ncbi:MAG: hypothetical protein ACTSUT_01885 [Promethearchaeota archaeon]